MARFRSARRTDDRARRSAYSVTAGWILAHGLNPQISYAAPSQYERCAARSAAEHGSHTWKCCVPDGRACTRPGPARLVLFSTGGIALGLGLVAQFVLGDSLGSNDPSTFLAAAGLIAGSGALVGALTGRWLNADGPRIDRVRADTLALQGSYSGASTVDETSPPNLRGSFAPTLRFAHGDGRLRLTGHVGGDLGRHRVVDPRRQVANADGSAPIVRTSKILSVGVGLDLAVALPYPVMSRRRSQYLGAVELRWKPDFQFRRENIHAGNGSERWIERTMLLPLVAGLRWHVSPRQRFTVYFGPRFDIVSYAEGPNDRLRRGSPQLAPLYGEAWYDIDVPLQGRKRRSSTIVNSQFSAGYVHSRFDGTGLNIGPVVGFLGTIHLRAHLRIIPRGSKVAWQPTLAAVLGQGLRWNISLGVTLPEIRGKRR